MLYPENDADRLRLDLADYVFFMLQNPYTLTRVEKLRDLAAEYERACGRVADGAEQLERMRAKAMRLRKEESAARGSGPRPARAGRRRAAP